MVVPNPEVFGSSAPLEQKKKRHDRQVRALRADPRGIDYERLQEVSTGDSEPSLETWVKGKTQGTQRFGRPRVPTFDIEGSETLSEVGHVCLELGCVLLVILVNVYTYRA